MIDTMSMFSINVRSRSDKHLTNVEVSFEDLQTITVLMLKEMVYEASGIPIAQQTLINSAGAEVMCERLDMEFVASYCVFPSFCTQLAY